MRKHAMMALAAALMLGAPAVGYAASNDHATCNTGVANQIGNMDRFDPFLARSATNTMVVQVPDCASADVRSALASKQAAEVTADIANNPDALQAIQSLGATKADVLGAITQGNTLRIFIDAG